MKTLNEGLHENVPMDDYINDPAPEPSLSTGTAGALLNECPLKAWIRHPRLNTAREDDSNGASDLGKIAHDLLLEGGTAKACVIKPEDYRSKPTKADPEGAIPKGWTNNAIKAARDLARSNGLVPILPWDYAKVQSMVQVAMEALERAKGEFGFSLSAMLAERTLVWQECYGLSADLAWCRSRPDLITPDFKIAIDYKTTATSAEPNSVAKLITNNDYDLQAALIRAGIHKTQGHTPDVVFMVQEVEPPYLVSFVGLSPTFAEIADKKLERAVYLWAECMKANKWPGYPERVAWVEPPAWEIAKAEILGAL